MHGRRRDPTLYFQRRDEWYVAGMGEAAIAVDLGTAGIRVHGAADRGARVFACDGHGALVGGVISNHEAVIAMLRPLLRRVRGWAMRRPRVLACVPTDADATERAAVVECVRRAGARAVRLVPEPLAAAVGAGVDVGSPYATLVLDLGEGVTDAAVVADGAIVASHARRGGCAELRAGGVADGIATTPEDAETRLRHGGIACIGARIDAQLDVATALLAAVPSRLACEVLENGIVLTGGGALFPGVEERLRSRTGLTVRRADDPLAAVVRGAAAMLPIAERSDLWRSA